MKYQKHEEVGEKMNINKYFFFNSLYVDENREHFTIYHALIILNVKFYIGNKVEENIRKFDRLSKEMEND